MKKRVLLYFIFCFFISNYAVYSQHHLQFAGNIDDRNTSKKLKHAKIELFTSDSLLLRTAFTNDSGNYYLQIPLDTQDVFVVKASYPGFVHKFFTVSTTGIPKRSLEYPFANIEASMSLFEKVTNVDYSILNKALNKYYYNAEKDNYAYDKEYLKAALVKLEELKLKEQQVLKENDLEKARMLEQKRSRIFIGAALLILVIILLGGFLFFKKKKN